MPPSFAMPTLCCSPDFTNPDADARTRAVEHEAATSGVTPVWADAAAYDACSAASDIRELIANRELLGWWEPSSGCCLSPARLRQQITVAELAKSSGDSQFRKSGDFRYVEMRNKECCL
jgi:hypothetical protein